MSEIKMQRKGNDVSNYSMEMTACDPSNRIAREAMSREENFVYKSEDTIPILDRCK